MEGLCAIVKYITRNQAALEVLTLLKTALSNVTSCLKRSSKDSIRTLGKYCRDPNSYVMWYQRSLRYHEKSIRNTLDPNCTVCKGTGWMLVRIDENDVCKDICTCADEIIEAD